MEANAELDARARRALAVDLLQKQGEVTVAQISELTGVSAMTVRRDLAALEREGALRRVHGGALSVASRGYAPPYSVRAGHEAKAKRRIGEAVAGMLREGETVILDVGTTTMEVARSLQGRRGLTVITSGLQIADLLSKEPGIRLMLTGGTLTPGELSLVGDLAEDAFSKLRFDTFVMGAAGVDADAGCTEFNVEDARVKRAALATVKRCIVVASGSKLGVVKFALITPLDRVDVIVTDANAPKDQLEALASTHAELVVV